MTGDAPSPGQGPGPADESRSAARAAPLALYRRYRPATFAELKGQDHVTEPLRQALRSGRVNHAYLFSGPRGCGKTSSARILARSLNCEQGPTPDPCGVCASCVALAPSGPGSIDVIEIDAASHGGVDDARDLRERAFYAPVAGRYKIYIIDEAHMVTREGFNALLKLVEEPPPHLKFVFATTEPEKVIATIRSRTHHYPFRLVPPAVLRELLKEILASEGITYEPTVLPAVIRAGAGSVRDSLSVLDQLIAGSDESGLTYARAVSLLGYTDDRLLDEVVQAFAARDGAAVFGAIDRVVEGGHDPRRFAADLLDRLRDLIVLAAVPDAIATGLLDIPADRSEEMSGQANSFGQAELARAAEIISTGLVEMRGATSPRLLLELMSAQVLLPAPGVGDHDLRRRLEQLERRLDGVAPGAIPAPAARPAAVAPAPARPVAAAPSAPAPAPAAPAPAASSPAAPSTPSPNGPAQDAPARPRPEPVPAGHADGQRTVPAAPAPTPAPAPAAGGTVDLAAIQASWPDILETVRGARKVAWMLLINATVGSFADGALTIEFAREGDAKGFTASGHDGVLADVLRARLGITPQIRTAVRTGPGPGGPGPGGSSSGGSGPRGGSAGGGGQNGPARAVSSGTGQAGASVSAANSVPGGRGGNTAADAGTTPPTVAAAGPAAPAADAPAWEGPTEPWDNGPDWDPRDEEDLGSVPPDPRLEAARRPGAAPGARPVSAAQQLIERELGGRIIDDLSA
jgi:DNA polymerase III subunit gamma/tau